MKTTVMLVVTSALALTGCAHNLMRGSVAMKGNDQEAHVCLGDGEVKGGDKVTLYKNECTGVKGGGKSGYGDARSCTKVKLGFGTVERTLNEHYSVIKVDPGVQFEEGSIVEKS